MRKRRSIELSPDQTLVISWNTFDEDVEINLDQLLKVDIANLSLEVITFPIMLNQIGLLMADANYNVNVAKMQVEQYEGQLAESLRSGYVPESGSKGMSNEKVAEAIARDPKYILKKQIYFKRIKEQEIINSLYWSMKSKDSKLDKLSMSIQAGDVETAIVESKLRRFNYIDLKILKSNGNL